MSFEYPINGRPEDSALERFPSGQRSVHFWGQTFHSPMHNELLGQTVPPCSGSHVESEWQRAVGRRNVSSDTCVLSKLVNQNYTIYIALFTDA